MKILKMSIEDLKDVARLGTQLGYPNSVETIERRFLSIIDNSNYAMFVAKSDSGNVLGWIQINFEPTSLMIDARADVAALVVDENQRSKGVGKALLHRAEQWAEENNIPVVRVRSNIKREAAHRFYLREGYEISKASNIFTKNLSE